MLQWADFDRIGGRLHVKRAIVDSRTGIVKTERSAAPLPLPKFVAAYFMALYKVIHYKEQDDWVFASDFHAGELPLNSKWIQQKTLRPAGKAIGLNFNLGWHTLRHSFKNLLKATGADPEMMRDLMRHSDTHTTTQIYGEVEFDRMQDANKKAVDLAFRGDVKL